MKKGFIMALTLGMVASSGFAQTKIIYPKAPKGKVVDTYFGVKVADPYRWLENDTSKATAKWVAAENKVTQDYLKKIPYRDAIRNRLMSLANYEKISAPSKEHGKYYFSRNSGLQNQSVIYVQDSLQGEVKVFLDPNTLSQDGTVALKGLDFSNNGKYASYIISRSGSDWQEIYVIDMATGKLLNDHIIWSKFSGTSWHGDGFYYSAYDAPVKGKEFSNVNQAHKIYYHKIGTPQSADKLIYSNPAYPKRFYTLDVDEDEATMYLEESGDGSGNNIFVKDLKKPQSDFVRMTTDMNNIYSPLTRVGDKIYIYTNYKAPNSCVMVADINNPAIANWKMLVPETKNVLSSATVIGGKLFLTYTKDVADHAYVYNLDGKLQNEIKLPSFGSVGFAGKEKEKDCYYSFSSFINPGAIYKYDIDTNTSSLYRAPKIAFNPDDFVCEQVFFNSKDGTKVPMFIVYKKGIKRDGNNPTLFYGYGGFNISLSPSFSASYLPFLENGGIYVSVNLRGGNEYGEAWHLAGTKMHKQNVFDDFIEATEYMIAQKYTNKNKTMIMGGSNGGLLVGACMTQRPDLYKVAIPIVGVMDMLRYHKFTIGWNWAADYGTSADSKAMFTYLKKYSPLHNLKPGVRYPATIVSTADHDDRVVPAHSFKFAATLQACNDGYNPTLIRIESEAGHGGGMPMLKMLDLYTDIIAFGMYNVGMDFK